MMARKRIWAAAAMLLFMGMAGCGSMADGISAGMAAYLSIPYAKGEDGYMHGSIGSISGPDVDDPALKIVHKADADSSMDGRDIPGIWELEASISKGGLLPDGHIWELQWVGGKPPCGTEGECMAVCRSCGLKTYMGYAASAPHDTEPILIHAGTCTDPEIMAYVCNICGEEVRRQAYLTDVHSPEEYTDTVHEDGIPATKTWLWCPECGEVLRVR